LAFVLDLNVKRRHLNESQRAMIAAELATMRQGARTDLASIEAMSQAEAANRLNVSRSGVQRAALVRDKAIPEIAAAVRQGHMSVSVAARVAELPELRSHHPAKPRLACRRAARVRGFHTRPKVKSPLGRLVGSVNDLVTKVPIGDRHCPLKSAEVMTVADSTPGREINQQKQ
jgi:predicted DNA-binding protein (UPF0251 family)